MADCSWPSYLIDLCSPSECPFQNEKMEARRLGVVSSLLPYPNQPRAPTRQRPRQQKNAPLARTREASGSGQLLMTQQSTVSKSNRCLPLRNRVPTVRVSLRSGGRGRRQRLGDGRRADSRLAGRLTVDGVVNIDGRTIRGPVVLRPQQRRSLESARFACGRRGWFLS